MGRANIALVLDHVSIQCADPMASKAFYERVLAPLGGRTILTFGDVHGIGVEFPSFWLGPIGDAGAAHRDIHICFRAQSREQVDAFVEAARAEGVEDPVRPAWRTCGVSFRLPEPDAAHSLGASRRVSRAAASPLPCVFVFASRADHRLLAVMASAPIRSTSFCR